MPSVQPCPIPTGAALHAYSIPGTYTDCYSVTIPGNIVCVQPYRIDLRSAIR
jgi:hypothetical protein